ncbi:MAG: TonB-dependent receptor [Dysgonamonadaceae bacterium]|jgi:TonB-linked SusC/RagA family outer membrane protein|nr:TonB-dependent receptor [Dysgonamonadaceae bacterium]
MENKTNQKQTKLPKAWQYLLVALLFLSGTLNAVAQQTVSGTVTDGKTGKPLIGVVVVNTANHSQSTTTSVDGKYTISVPENSIIAFSFLGYQKEEVNVFNRTSLDVALKVDEQIMEEVVVIGYGSIRKKDLTGAVSVVKADDLRDRASTDVISSIRGLTSGVKVTSSGLPGQTGYMTIRGLGSLTSNSPLFVIDGMIGGSDMHVNVQDIESIQILKDASSAAIYGSRAANGVVIITTKQGKEGPMKIEFSSQLTVSKLPRYDLMDAETWKIYDDRAYDEAIYSRVAGITQRQNHYEGNTDWQEEMLRTGILQNYNLSFSGGQEAGRYFVSLNRMVDKGALYGTGYDRYGFRVNTSGKKGIFSYGENLFFTTSNRKNLNGNPWSDFIAISPTIPVHDESNPGGYGYGDPDRANNYGRNLVAMQELQEQDNPEKNLRGNIWGQISLFDMFHAKLNIAYVSYQGVTNTLRKKGNWTMGQGSDEPYLTFNSYQSDDILIEQTYNFKHKFGKHDVDAIAGITYNTFKGQSNWTTKLNPLTLGDKYIEALNAATGNTTGGGAYDQAALISYLGRINYSYNDKYLLQLTGRRDGTSRLPKKNRWDNFASVSLGWRISHESFFQVPFINDLKIRANYGTLGSSNIGYYDYQAVINTAPRAVFGSPEYKLVGMTQSRLTNIDLVWEKTTQANIGLDAAFLNNRLRVSMEYFDSKSKDLLVYLPILMTSGNEGGNPAVNAGSLSNKGIEVEIGWRDKIGKDFSYSASLNFSKIHNKILDLGYGRSVYYESLSKAEIGQPLGMFYLYKMLGIFQSEEEIRNYKNAEGKIIQPDALPGDIKYDDYNGDGIISSEDRQIVGNPWPAFEAGLSLSASYKNVDIGINAYGRFNYDVWNGSAAAAADFANNQNNFNGIVPWTQEHPVNDRPRIVFGDSRNSRGDQDRWLEDGTFFRFSEITLGYSLPKPICNKIRIDAVRLGITLQNLITLTNYSGLDPEFLDSGIFTLSSDGCSFPNPKSVLFSLSFKF